MSSILALLAVGCSASVTAQTPIATETLRPYRAPTASATATTLSETATLATTPRPTATPFTHTVQKDETLLEIAARYGISLEMLLAANPGINPRLLSIGQQLTIPGPEGGQLIPELPTTTPIPVQLSEARCFVTLTRGLTCLAAVSNPGDEAVEGVVVRFTIDTTETKQVSSAQVYTPLNLLRPGETLPVSASFSMPSGEDYTVSAMLLGAIPAANPDERYAEVTLTEGARASMAGGTAWNMSGSVQVSTPSGGSFPRLVVLAVGYDADGAIVGFAEAEIGEGAGSDGQYAYELSLFSLGPPIEDAKVLAEASKTD
jgi:LysM repeat protein